MSQEARVRYLTGKLGVLVKSAESFTVREGPLAVEVVNEKTHLEVHLKDGSYSNRQAAFSLPTERTAVTDRVVESLATLVAVFEEAWRYGK
ncbi:hypothetical protein SEA_SAPO_58 [Gordonia phage Sapo]|nr:hypothetical protein SEA_SAPO_58 [Gordonia phage Sapo]